MLVNSIGMQMSEMLRKKTVVFTYFALLLFVTINFLLNMIDNKNIQYISEMYDPIKKLTLSDWSISGYYMMEYYPLLVVIPTASACLKDRDTMIGVYIQSKTGSIYYWFGKLVAVFLTTFFVFTIPFLFEIVLSCICFSLNSIGDPSNLQYFQSIENENQYFISKVWLSNRVLYGIMMTLIFGLISGVLAIFNFSLTTSRFFKYKIFTFFPIYILFYLTLLIETFAKKDYTMNYFFILRMFNITQKNYPLYALFLLCLICISIILIGKKANEDYIL